MNDYEKLLQYIESSSMSDNTTNTVVKLCLTLIESKNDELEKLKKENTKLKGDIDLLETIAANHKKQGQNTANYYYSIWKENEELKNEIEVLKTINNYAHCWKNIKETNKQFNQQCQTDLEEFIQNTDRYELQTVNGRKVEKVYYVGSNTYHVLFIDDPKPVIYGKDGKTLRYPSKFINMFAEDYDLIMLKR